MVIKANISREKWIHNFTDNLSHWFYFGEERYTGWCKFGFFSVRYHSGKELWQFYYQIFNKCLGYIRNKNGQTTIRYLHFHGLTDPVSLLTQYIGSFLILYIVKTRFQLDLGDVLVYSLLPTAIAALFTCIFTAFSGQGYQNQRELDSFLDMVSHDSENV